jgi:hypothetical protein
MLTTKWMLASAFLILGTVAAPVQVSGKTTDSPTTGGYAASPNLPAKDRHATGPQKHAVGSAMAPRRAAPAGTSPAETAGASSPAGSPAMQKDAARRSAS